MTTINARIEEKVKTRAAKTLEEIGLDMSTAINIFLRQVIAEKGLPFIPSANTFLIKAKWDKEVVEALKTRGYETAKAAHKSIK